MLGAVFGYPLVAGFSATFGLPNSLISLALRASIALLSLYLILDNISTNIKGIGRLVLFCTAVFVLLYLLRLVTDTMLSTTMPFGDAINYWMWAIGSAFLPVLGLSMARNYDIDWNDFYRKAFIVTLVASLIVAMNVSTSVTNEIETYESGRARLETLNPISLGHLGASLLLLSLASFWHKARKRRAQSIMLVAGVVIGLSLVIASNSRGPIAATAAALIFAWLVLPGRSKGIVTLIFIVAAVGFAPVLLWFENNFGITTYSRLFGQSFSAEINVVTRLDLYLRALQAFVDHPFFGAGINVAQVGFYPHNVTLEAFLSVGILGGLLFFVIQLLTVILAWKICRARKDLLWISLLVVQYMVAAQFSGALYASPPFWAVIGILVFASSVINPSAMRRHQPVARKQLVT